VNFLFPNRNPNPSEEIQVYRIIQLYENGYFSLNDKAGPLLTKGEWETLDGVFPTATYTPVFPSGLVGLRDKDSRLFNASVNMARLYGPDMMGWDPLPILMARLGLAEELADVLKQHPDKWQFYCNGLGHYGPLNYLKPESTLRFARRRVSDAALSGKEQGKPENQFLFETWPFRHMDFEALGVFSTAMNEALLQSYDGVIRIAPAAAKQQNARFTLHAVGGFVVSAELQNGSPRWVSIRSLRGSACRITNPWPSACVYVNSKLQSRSDEMIIELAMGTNDIITLTPDEQTWQNWNTVEVDYPANAKEKTSPGGMTTLGLPRMF